MVQHPLKSADVNLVASCSELEHQRSVICLLGLCKLPRFQLETVSEVDAAGAERKQQLCALGAFSRGQGTLAPFREGAFPEGLCLSFLRARDGGTKPMQ